MNRKSALLLLRVVIALGAIAYLGHMVPVERVWSTLTTVKAYWIVIILALAELSMLQQAMRWRHMMAAEGVDLPSLGTFFRFTALGSFFNLLLPSGIGGDAVKSVAMGRFTQRMGHSMASTLVARLLGLLALVLLFWTGVPFLIHAEALSTKWLWLMFLFAFSIGIGVWVLIQFGGWFQRIPRLAWIAQIGEELVRYRTKKALLVRSFADSLLIQALILVSHYFMFRSVGAPIPLSVVLVAFPLVTVATLLPVSIYGIGVRESLALLLYGALAGLQAEQILAATLLGYVVVLFQAIQGAWFWLRYRL